MVMTLALASCAHQRTEVLKISQQETDLNMVQRVKIEAEAECGSDDGLRGVTWPYPSLPGDELGLAQTPGFTPFRSPTSNVSPSATPSRDQRAAASLMRDLARNARAAYLHDAGQVGQYGPQAAIYTCNDGVQLSSTSFVFVP